MQQSALLTLYEVNAEPDLKIFDTLRIQPQEHVERIYDVGRWQGQTYCVTELISGGTLSDFLRQREADLDSAIVLLREVGTALASFSTIGLRHRALEPNNILVRTSSPFDLVMTGFESARLSDFDLDVVSPLQITRYSAPEAIVGAVSASSDWWSLGVILLEHLTRGACFTDVSDQAFMLSTVTRGIEVPAGLNPRLENVLHGLLARDPSVRWQWAQLNRWLEGETIQAPAGPSAAVEGHSSQPLTLGGHSYFRADEFALAAADRIHWDEGSQLGQRGAITTWAEQSQLDPLSVAALRRATQLEGVPDDHRHALILQALNRDLPLSLRGDIVTPDWLLKNPIEAYEIISGPLIGYLRQSERERWLVQVADRVQRLRERARSLEIALDEERFRINCLALSRPRLEALWESQRHLLPDSDHAGLASLLDRTTLAEEDLILLLSAAHTLFESSDAILERAAELARKHNVTSYDGAAAAQWLSRSRRAMYEELGGRLTGFARCGIETVDNWADTLRVQRRIALPRVLLMLCIPAAAWKPPPRQQYIENLLEFFEKRAASVAQRGPLVRLIIGKTTPRVDLYELASTNSPASTMLDRFVSRAGESIRLDPAVLTGQAAVTERLRRLQSHAALYRRDTGVDGLYLGFPFIVMRSASTPRPRILPLFLWPARINLELGSRSNGAFSFDTERNDVRLNPAVHTLFSQDEVVRFAELLDELLQSNALNGQRVVDVLGSLIPPRERTFTRLPAKEYTLSTGQRQLVYSAVLFHAEFMGQAIAEDLRALRRRSVVGTALEAAIRSQGTVTAMPAQSAEVPIAEMDRYPVVASDPSQDVAVLKARKAPGLLIEGPPGTGKSQTIVNIVSDCIGRGESVLVVCQKQVALQVVAKRLEAEGIGERTFVVGDLGSDRQRVITKLREQLTRINANGSARIQDLNAKRRTLAQRIASIEAEMDAHHNALHAIDLECGMTYRSVLGELIEIEQEGGAIEAPALRDSFVNLTPAQVSELQDAIEPLALAWLDSRYEVSPLAVIRVFSADAAVAREFRRDFVAFVTNEAARSKTIAACPDAFEITEMATHERWLATHDPTLAGLNETVRRHLSLWYDQFAPASDQLSKGAEAIATLEKLKGAFKTLDQTSVSEQRNERTLAEELADWPQSSCTLWRDRFRYVLTAKSMWSRANPMRIVTRRKLNRFLKERSLERSSANLQRVERALSLELALRPLRAHLRERLTQFENHGLAPDTISAQGIDLGAEQLLVLLRPFPLFLRAISACPLASEAESAIRMGESFAYAQFATRYRGALLQLQARQRSEAALEGLSKWFSQEWLHARVENIRARTVPAEELRRIGDAIPRLAAYQTVRRRVPGLPPPALACLKLLRRYEELLERLPRTDVATSVRQTLARESRLAWKERLEQMHPSLLLDRDSLAVRTKRLEDLDGDFVQLNRDLIAADSGLPEPPAMPAWEAVTRLTGPRARRLREFFEGGLDLGLLGLRPVWLMNPDVASRALPLRAGLFDVVVFDEASQIPVEHALPSLYRAKRVVVSGDEKQMPPTSFFSSRLDSDEDELFDADEIDDAVTDSARAEIEEKWTRREIKDCEDLLTLARACLPAAMLEIHYRSNFRELIDFSNAAYYAGNLYVPVQKPQDRVKRDPPIVVRRINGTYQKQTNSAEARAVVDVVHEIWKTPGDHRPSLGVVTFNRKQADLIEDLFEQRAEQDLDFKRILSAEGQRRQDNEDMSFFVKNVENVQGDERDVIVFSTTFGRNESGAFRRTFGVLGQQGGERRLNVAITRARDKVILVTSMPVGDISDMMATGRPPAIARDYLQSYMDYASKISDGDLASARAVAERCQIRSRANAARLARVNDGFVRSVQRYLHSLGVQAQATGDGLFGLDFAVERPGSGAYVLGLECDGPTHGLLLHARARDVWRPNVLRRSMPMIHRVSGHSWYHEREQEQKRLEAAVRTALAAA